MPDNDTITLLNKLRNRARAAYLYLGLALIALTAVFLLFDTPSLGIGLGILILLLYLCFLRKDIQNFRDQFKKEAVLCSIGKDIQAEKYVPKNLLTLDEVRQDGCVPINNTQGIVRVGVSGSCQGAKAELTDISYTYMMGEGKGKKAISISGCYLKLHRSNALKTPFILCEKGAISDIILEEYYAVQGLGKYELEDVPEEVGEHWDCYCVNPAEVKLSDEFCKKLQRISRKSKGTVIMKWSKEALCVFVRSRYLGVCEPDLKIPVTREGLNQKLFPELKDILNLI